MKNTNTTDNIHSQTTAPEPEWGRLDYIQARFGISRPKAYQLIDKGLLESVSLAEGKQSRGARLVRVQSVIDYIEGKLATN